MANAGESDGAAPFESISELRRQHESLLVALDRRLEQDASAAGEAAAMEALGAEILAFQNRAVATGVFLEHVPDRTAAQVLIDYWSSSLARTGAGVSKRLARFDARQLPDLKDKTCPYVGLDAFRTSTYFFGRDADTADLRRQVLASPLTIVLGASGSGKSSLVMGGLLPALRDPKAAQTFRILPVFVPGDAALERLSLAAAAVAPFPGAGSAEELARLRDDPGRLATLLGGQGQPPALVVVDQFEEVFTLATEPDRNALAANFGRLLEAGAGHRVVLTLREEFGSQVVKLDGIRSFRDRATYLMRPLGYEELVAAVSKPAAIVNLQFQPGIVDDLVKKVLGQAAALPLLQFTLRRLWDNRDRNRITWEVYREVKDPLEALKASADAFYDSLADQTRDEMRRVLLELVRVDDFLEAYRQPLRKAHLLRAGRANTEEVLGLLAENDYLRITPGASDADTVVEIKHESLIRNWPRFVDWIGDKRREQRQRMAITQAAERWARSGRPVEGLLTGWQLQEAQRNADLVDLEREFVEASAAAVARVQHEKEEALQRELVKAQALAAQEAQLRKRTWRWLAVAVAVAVFFVLWSALLGIRSADVVDQSRMLQAQNVKLVGDQAALRKEHAKLQAEYDALLGEQVAHAVRPSPSVASAKPAVIHIYIGSEDQRERAEDIRSQLVANGIEVPGITVEPAPIYTQVRYFRAEEREDAERIQQLLRKYLGLERVDVKLVTGLAVSARKYEIWFGRKVFAAAAPSSSPATR
jgi:hypothetical protein